jgi:TRAP-type C4-dicarboxylate transport system substrate-binding protein
MVVVNKKAWNKLDDATKKIVMNQAVVAERKGWNLSNF